MDGMTLKTLVARAKVVLTAAPTYLVAAAVLIPFVVDQLATVLPTTWSETVAQVAGKAVAVLGVAVAIIRRVTPVPAAQRGLLPLPPAGDGPPQA